MINKKNLLRLTVISLLCFNVSLAEDKYYDPTSSGFYSNIFYNGAFYNKNQLVKEDTNYGFNIMGGGLGFIYDTGQNIRIELEGIFSGNSELTTKTSNVFIQGGLKKTLNKSYMSGMLNAYYNIHSDYQVSSYFGFGMGFSSLQFSNWKVVKDDKNTTTSSSSSNNTTFDGSYPFTLQLKAGVIMTGVSDHLMPYIGYRLLYFTGKDITYKITGESDKTEDKIAVEKGTIDHNVQLGVIVPLNIGV